MPKFRYVPLLRSKAGEAKALENLTGAAKDRLFPLIHLVSKPPQTFVAEVSKAWAGRRIAVDGLFNFATTGTTNDFVSVFTDLGKGKVLALPSVEIGAPSQYIAAVSKLANKFSPGLVVKSNIGQLPVLTAWVAAQGWSTGDIDLVLLAGHVPSYDLAQLQSFAIHAITTHLSPKLWRSITLASSAAPQYYTALPLGRTDVPRLDWVLWNNVSSALPFQIDYGDYGTSHPDLADVPGYAMAKATVSVRYTLDDEWIILKGTQTSGKRGVAMPVQFLAHAKSLSADRHFGGIPGGCWGDQRISQIGSGSINSGSRTTWVEIGANRHLSHVAWRLP